jgi:hypothetical protein
MSTDTDNVRVAQYGEIYFAPLGTPLPTTATAEPNVAFDLVGGVSEDGVTLTPKRTSEDKKDWGGNSVRDLQTEQGAEFDFVMIEDTAANRTLVGLGSGFTGAQLPLLAWIIDWHDEDAVTRYVIERSRIVATDPIKLNAKELVSYGVKLSPKVADDGFYFHEYRDADGVS